MTKDEVPTATGTGTGTGTIGAATPTSSSSSTSQRQQHQPNEKDGRRTPQRIHPSTIPMIGGFMGGVVSTTLLLPLDIVKLRLQVTESTSTDPNRKYRSFRAIRIIGGIIKYEGIAGLYQGLTPAVIGSSVSWGGYFFFYENFKQLYVQYKNKPSTKDDIVNTATAQLTSIDNFFLACTSGAIMVGLTNPIWLIKTRMQLQMKRAQQQQQQNLGGKSIPAVQPYTGMMDAVRTIIREEGGVKALYKGSGPALLLTSHGGVQFVVYEYLRKHYQAYFISKQNDTEYTSNDRRHQPAKSGWSKLQQSAGYLTMGGIAKIAATTTTYPLQLIKARMQQRMNTIDLLDDNSVRLVQRDGDSYKTMTSTIRKIYIHEGIGGFFKGCITNAIRVAPGAAITFVVYEEVTDVLKQQL